MCFSVNKNKIKLMASTNRTSTPLDQTGNDDNRYNFKAVYEFIYIGSALNKKNVRLEIMRSIVLTNIYIILGLNKRFKGKIVSRETSIQLYQTLIQSVLLSGAESYHKQMKHHVEFFRENMKI